MANIVVWYVCKLFEHHSFLLLNGFGSAVTINIIAVAQCAINAYLAYNGKVASLIQKTVFMILFFAGGILSYNEMLDILPISASLIFALSVFQKRTASPRGVTVIKAVGAFSSEKKTMLFCALKESEVPSFQKIILNIDKEAFIVYSESSQIMGNGFYIYR